MINVSCQFNSSEDKLAIFGYIYYLLVSFTSSLFNSRFTHKQTEIHKTTDQVEKKTLK